MSRFEGRVAFVTGAGSGADKTWVFDAAQTSHTADSYTLNIGDATASYELDYAMMSNFTLSGGFDGLAARKPPAS